MPRHRSHAVVAWLCLGAVALIAYGSLYPFDLKANAGTQSLWAAIGELRWARAGRGDRVSNVLLYAPLGFCLALWLNATVRNRMAIVVAVASGAMLSLGIEVMQVFISSRVPSLWDVTLNTAGAFVGAMGGVAWRALSSRLPSTLSGGGRPDRVAWIVLILWLAAQWAPFAPHVSLPKLKAALEPLFDPQIDWWATLHWLVWWLTIAQIVFVIAGGARGMEMLLATIAAVLVARLFVIDQAFIASELAALLASLPILLLLHRFTPSSQRTMLLAVFGLLFVVDRLTPLNSSAAAHFDLWPFLAWMDAGMPVSWPALLKMLFEVAALTWLLKEAGAPLRTASLLVPLAVLVLEVSAVWTSNRGGSLTNPALALALCLLLRYVDKPRRRFG